ncbi:MAG: helix-turn-helix domain-containing protein [Parcubacteria group bacterium]|jgi:sugar-specific transcriptional regulator TrmB
MMIIREEYLSKLGLPYAQAKIYTLLLEKGEMRMQQISESSQIKRTTIYPIIKKMIGSGLVGVNIKGRTKYYFAKNPEMLLDRTREQKNFLEALMPQMAMLFNDHVQNAHVQFYNLPGAIKAVIKEINTLNPQKDELLAIEGDIESSFKIGFDFWKDVLKEKKRLGISSRTIIPSHEKENFLLKDHKIKLRTSASLQNFKMSLYLLPHKVIIMIPSQTMALVIENQVIKNGLEDMFELIWKRAKVIK